MTVIAWDGKTLAADKRTSDGGLPRTTTKIERAACGALLGASGDSHMCRMLRAWWKAGADPAKYPTKGEDATLMVVRPSGVVMYWGGPEPIEFEDRFTAIGSGRDFAIAAMHYGRTASEAVELACLYDSGCGNGIDTLTLE